MTSVAVMAAFSPFLQAMMIYNAENFKIQNRRIFIFSILLIALIGGVVCDLLYCVDNEFDIIKLTMPIGVLVGATEVTLTYASIAMKNDLVDDVIASLRKTIIQRKYGRALRMVCP